MSRSATSPRSADYMDRARRRMPGGVNSNVRLDAPAVVFERGRGARLLGRRRPRVHRLSARTRGQPSWVMRRQRCYPQWRKRAEEEWCSVLSIPSK